MLIKNLNDLQNNREYILFECIVGSKLYGLADENSDTDIAGVYIAPERDFYLNDYLNKVSDKKGDVNYYEFSFFMEQAMKNKPNFLELLTIPEDKILHIHPLFKELDVNRFVSKHILSSFTGFANSQLKKAYRINRKMLNPISDIRKPITEFMYILDTDGKSYPLSSVLTSDEIHTAGVSKSQNGDQMYVLYVDSNRKYNFRGLIKGDSNEVRLSSIPKNYEGKSYLFYFNKQGYSAYCKQYLEYQNWKKERNEHRHQLNLDAGVGYDVKNAMHTIRMLNVLDDVITLGQFRLDRTNIDREELLKIKFGEYSYQDFLNIVNKKFEKINKNIKKNHILGETPDVKYIHHHLYHIRKNFYNE
jgi:hypothetical protein